jgi:sigma-E factor negative regulatory protein RseB
VNVGSTRREVIRHDSELQCILPDDHKVLVETENDSGTLLGTLPRFDASLEANYRLELGEHSTVLGRPVRVLAVAPRDDLRFGYRLWIDEENRLPMRTDLCDAEGHVLEQVMFTSLKVGGPIADSAFHPDNDPSGFAWIRQGAAAARPLPGEPLWRLAQLPPGFHLSATSQQQLPGSDALVTHFMLSDGLASVSVFIEGPPAPPRQATEGQGRVGTAFAYSRVIDGHQVTAVGEVPPQTVEMIAAGVARAKATRRNGFGLSFAGQPQQ